jgi:hypothetical protein
METLSDLSLPYYYTEEGLILLTNRTRFTAELIVLATIGGAIWATAKPTNAVQKNAQEVIRAQRFEVVDSKGKLRGVLATQDNGDPILTMLDSKGDPVINVAIVDKTPGITIGKKPGSGDGIVLAIGDDGSKALLFEQKKGKVGLGVDGNGAPSLEIQGKDGKKREFTTN